MKSDCGEDVICIDDTQGFDGVRFYDKYFPSIRAQRSGLKVAYGVAMRGRYNPDGSISQNLELNGEEISNTITTVGKDSLVVIGMK